MEVYRGVTIYKNEQPITYGKVLPRQETQILQRYEKKAWPKNIDRNFIMSQQSRRLRTNSSVSSEKNHINKLDSTFISSAKKHGDEYSGKKRPISAKVEIINQMKRDFRDKRNTNNMSLNELKMCLNQKKHQNKKLNTAVQNQYNFAYNASYDPDVLFDKSKFGSISIPGNAKGNMGNYKAVNNKANILNKWSSIKNFSESAFNVRRKGEHCSKQVSQADSEINRLVEKRDHQLRLIQGEQSRINGMKNQGVMAHKEFRNLQQDNTKKARQLVHQEFRANAMKGRFHQVEIKDKNIDNIADDNLKATLKAEKIRMQNQKIVTRADIGY